jgi:phage terminase small subunit
MKTGRPKKPEFLRGLEGNGLSAKSTVQSSLSPMPNEPPMPLEGIALTEWARISSEAFWLVESDWTALADRCVCWARLQEAEADVAARGLLIGRKKTANPSARLARQYRTAVQRYDLRLGLAAAAREGVGAARQNHNADYIDPVEAALCWPYGFTSIRIWRELRQGKVEHATTAAERNDLKVDRIEADRRLAAWKASVGIDDGGADAPVAAPGLNASAAEWQAYSGAKNAQSDKIEKAIRQAGLDPRKV